MPAKKLKAFLDEHDVHYVSIQHSKAYTMQMIAESVHIRGKELAKTVIVRMDENLVMAVLPASDSVDVELFRQSTGAKKMEIASEAEFKDLFPDCELGAMPPFGNLYDIPVFVSPRLAEDEQIAFNAGTHTELVQLAYADFAELVSPVTCKLSNRDQ